MDETADGIGPDASIQSGDGRADLEASADSTMPDGTPGDGPSDSIGSEVGTPDALADSGSSDGAVGDSSMALDSAAPDALGTADTGGQDSGIDSAPPPGQIVWAHRLAAMAAYALAIDTDNVLVTAAFPGTINVGGVDLTSAGMDDVLLARFAKADGSHRASARFGGPADEFPVSVRIAADGTVYLGGLFGVATPANLGGADLAWAGGTGNDIFFAEYTTGFSHKWSKRIGDIYDDRNYRTASFDSAGNIYTATAFQGTVDYGDGSITGLGGSDAVYARYNETGALNSFLRFGTPTFEWAQAAIYTSGAAVVGGEFTSTINLNGATGLPNAGGNDIFVGAFTAAGNAQLWTFHVGGPGDETNCMLAADGAGHIYVAGDFQQSVTIGGQTLTSNGQSDIFLVRLSSTGTVDWAKSFGGPGNDVPQRLASSPSGELAITGTFYNSVDFGGGARTSVGNRDIFVATYNGADGSYRWDHTFGSSGDDLGEDVDVDTDGSVYAVAFYTGPIDFGLGTLGSGGGDSVALRFDK